MTKSVMKRGLTANLKGLVQVKHEIRLPETSPGNQPDILCYAHGYYGMQLGVKIINHQKFRPYFLDLLTHYHKAINRLINNGTLILTQETMTDWQLWLIQHYSRDWEQSPYSWSFYNSHDISWNHKPENSLRLSDHWNFENGDELHCQTDDANFKNGWALGRYQQGKYHIIKHFNNQPIVQGMTDC